MRRLALSTFRRLPRPVRLRLIRLIAPSYTLGAVTVMTRPDGALLLVEQRHAEGWALPGGLVQRGEQPGDALVREVAEEVGITVNLAALPPPIAVVAPEAQRVDIVYRAALSDDVTLAPVDGEIDITGIGWFSLDALPEVTPPTLEILRSARLI